MDSSLEERFVPNCSEERISVPGGEIVAYCFGAPNSEKLVLALNGGPGLPCDYIRDSHSFLAEAGWYFVAFDQLGTGKSDNPQECGLWTIERYAAEVEAVRRHFGAEKFNLLGQSWGGWLAIEYACRHSNRLNSLILESTCADIPTLRAELSRLRSALGDETVNMMIAHEAAGTTDHPEYQGAISILDYRHVCRLKERPQALVRSLMGMNAKIYNHMQGANEFVYTGNLANWSRLDDLSLIRAPTLITVGRHDEITPACAIQMRERIPNSEIFLFHESSHSAFFEEPIQFMDVLINFLDRNG